ncbi:hypothetical protein BTS2_2263 [Bacillus sp. TS-2]|nr:hypothetical protein BTS2_2263 [Bacillus sp. TS-2]
MPGWVEVIIRSIVGIGLLLIFTKLLAKKPMGELSAFEFALLAGLLIITSVSSIMLSIPPVLALVSILIWGLFAISLPMISVKSSKFNHFLNGQGITVIKDGKVLEDQLSKQHLTSSELMRKLRKKNIFQFADVEFALLETNGELNVLLKNQKKQQANFPSIKKSKQPEIVIEDGKMIDKGLTARKLNRDWLQTELAKMDVALENVFIGQIDQNGQLYVDLFDDSIKVAEPTVLPLLKAQLKKVEADLELFALDTEHPQAKQMYSWSSKQMNEVYHFIKSDLE